MGGEVGTVDGAPASAVRKCEGVPLTLPHRGGPRLSLWEECLSGENARVRHEKTRRPASSSRSCWAMTMPLPSPTGSLPITVMRPRSSSPAGGLRSQRRASTPTRLVWGQPALASLSSFDQMAKTMVSRRAAGRGPARLERHAERLQRLAVDDRRPQRHHLADLDVVERSGHGRATLLRTRVFDLITTAWPLSRALGGVMCRDLGPARNLSMSLRKLFAVLPALMIALLLGAPMLCAEAKADPVQTGHIEVELVSQEAGVAPGSTVYVALRQKIQPGWHTYWRNPGDAGDATRIVWTLPAGWTAGDIVWPTPEKSRVGPLLDFAYTGEVLLPVPISVPANAQPGSVVTLKAAAAFLVCEQVCVPEDAVVTLTLPVVAGVPSADPKWGAKVAETLAKAPKPAGLKAVFELQGSVLKLAVTGAPLKGADMSGAFFYPYSGKVIEHPPEQKIERGPDGLTLSLTPGYDFTQAEAKPTELSGVLALNGAAYEVTAMPGAIPAEAGGLGLPPAAPAKAHGSAARAPAWVCPWPWPSPSWAA